MKLLKWLFGSRKPALNKPVAIGSKPTDNFTEEIKSEERTIDENGNFLKAEEFEQIWIAEHINHKYGIEYQLSDDDCIDYYIWKEINRSDMYKKHLPKTMIISGKNTNIIFHGGCLGCKSQRIYGIDRCKGCKYFPTKNWSYPNLFIEGEDSAKMSVDDFKKLFSS